MTTSITDEVTNNLVRLAPSTRYQGSKRRILPWLYENFKDLQFETVLDGFGGTASVSYLFKLTGKSVTFNDILLSNYQTGVAIIENDSIRLEQSDIDFLLRENGVKYPCFIQDTFKGIYYTEPENKWLDVVSFNIEMLCQRYSGHTLAKKRALAYHSLFQACLCKRPFNLFHRRNLHLRIGDVRRSFGNKTTWDTDFSCLFTRFAREISGKIFSNGRNNRAICKDVMEIEDRNFDLVYLDPPYTRPSESHPKDYLSLYHFLEGIVDYDNWASRIDWSKANRCFVEQKSKWEQNSLEENFTRLFEKFRDSVIVISYGHPGTPHISRIVQLLKQFKSDVSVSEKEYAYKLNRRNHSGMYEILVIGK